MAVGSTGIQKVSDLLVSNKSNGDSKTLLLLTSPKNLIVEKTRTKADVGPVLAKIAGSKDPESLLRSVKALAELVKREAGRNPHLKDGTAPEGNFQASAEFDPGGRNVRLGLLVEGPDFENRGKMALIHQDDWNFALGQGNRIEVKTSRVYNYLKLERTGERELILQADGGGTEMAGLFGDSLGLIIGYSGDKRWDAHEKVKPDTAMELLNFCEEIVLEAGHGRIPEARFRFEDIARILNRMRPGSARTYVDENIAAKIAFSPPELISPDKYLEIHSPPGIMVSIPGKPEVSVHTAYASRGGISSAKIMVYEGKRQTEEILNLENLKANIGSESIFEANVRRFHGIIMEIARQLS